MILQSTSPLKIHDLYEPPAVPFSFDAPGWYILGGILAIAAILLTIDRVRRYIKNGYRRDALHELDILEHASELFPHLFVVLKKTAMHAFGREQVASLYGEEWLAFLEKTGVKVRLTAYREVILPAVYAGNPIEPEIREKILSNAKTWVKTHAG